MAKQRRRKDLDPSSTLADPDSIKAKAPELSFETDPLFVRTSALFDKGGAEGEHVPAAAPASLIAESSAPSPQAFANITAAAAAASSEQLSFVCSHTLQYAHMLICCRPADE